MPPNRSSGRNQRAIKACARCRKRKIKCDFAYPKCGSCIVAKTDCTGFDPISNQEQPRSIVTYLENKIASLEIELARLKGDQNATGHLRGFEEFRKLQQQLSQAVSLSEVTDRRFERMNSSMISLRSAIYLSPSSVPSLHLASSLSNVESRQFQIRSPSSDIASIPHQVVDIMLQNYSDVYLAQYPIVEESELFAACTRIYNKEASSFDFYIVSMALSISAHTLIRYDEARAIKAADEFWATAVLYFDQIQDDEPLKKLQALMMLCHYSFANPSVVNATVCSGAALRLCLQFGLHQEPPPESIRKKIDLNTQRRIFWTCYALDAQLHITMGRPHDLLISTVSTKYPDEDQDGSDIKKVAMANHMYSWRQFEVEITSMTIYPDRAGYYGLDNTLGQEWLESAQTRVENWRGMTNERDFAEKLEFREIMYHLAVIRLTRISPRSPEPDFAMRQRCIKTCINLIGEYAQNLRLGKLFYFFHAFWHLFEVGILLVEATHVGLNLISTDQETFLSSSDSLSMMRAMRSIPSILRKIARRCPPAETTAIELEELFDGAVSRLQNWSQGYRVSKAGLHEISMIRRYLLAGMDDEIMGRPSSVSATSNVQENPEPVLVSPEARITMREAFQLLQPNIPPPNPDINLYLGPGATPNTAAYPQDDVSQIAWWNVSMSNTTIIPDESMFLDATGMNLDDIFTAFNGGTEY